MGLLKAWLGPDYTGEMNGGNWQVMLASRRINVSDVLEVEAQLKKAPFTRVQIGRMTSEGWGTAPALAEPLDKASDAVLRALAVQAWAGGEHPVLTIRLGPDVQNDVLMSMAQAQMQGATDQDLGKLEIAANQAVQTITRAGRRILSMRHWANLVGLAVGVAFVCLVALLAVSVWPHVLWAIVAGLALIPTALLARQQLVKTVAKRIGNHRWDRVVVDHVTRDEWRRQRYDRRKDWKARGVGFLFGLAASAAGILLARAFGSGA